MTRAVSNAAPNPPTSGAAMPQPAPREVTRRARLQSWSDPRVRFWLLLSLGLLLIAGYYGWTRLWEWHMEGVLIGSGTALKATVNELGDNRPGKRLPPGTQVVLTFELNGKSENVQGVLQGLQEYVINGSEIDLHVDSKNPNHWTNLPARGPLAPNLLGLVLLIPLILVALLMAWFRRSSMLSVWREGMPTAALVIDKHQTPLAPLSLAVRCTMRDSLDKKLHTVFVPRHIKVPPRGDTIWLLTSPSGRGPILAAAWFE